MKILLLFCAILSCGIVSKTFAEAESFLKITEVAPLKIQDEEEWFEFSVQGSSVDMSQWKISNGKTTVKSFASVLSSLRYSSEVIPAESGIPLSFSFPSGLGIFFWIKSPISLPNDGGKIQILDGNDQILSEVDYPKLKSGTISGNPYSEVWVRDQALDQFFPVRYEPANPDSFFHHSRGTPNPSMPLKPEEFELRLHEIGPDESDHDFIELKLLAPTRERANLPRINLKHNGSVLWEGTFSASHFPFRIIFLTKYLEFSEIENDSLIRFELSREGLAAGSGTFEVTSWIGTSWEKNEDFFCFQDEVLSETEGARVIKFQNTFDWAGSCLEIADLPSGASVGRQEFEGDGQTFSDFSFWPHPTPGGENTIKNSPPLPIIEVQNDLKSALEVPFSINLSGEKSSDSDGVKDIVQFQWSVNEILFSESPNPGYYRIENPGIYTFSLKVTDILGAIGVAQLTIEAIKPIPKNVTLVETSSSKLSEIGNPQELEDFLLNQPLEDPFWGDFFLEIKEGKKPLILKALSKEPSELYYATKTFREKAFLFQNQHKIRKNLGLIFCENY